MTKNKPRTIKVTCRDGCRMPLPAGVPWNSPIKYVTPETPIEVVWCSFIRRRINAGDLIRVDEQPTAKSKAASKSKTTKPKATEAAEG